MGEIIWVLWDERSGRVFRGVERDPKKIGPSFAFMSLCGLPFERPFVTIL